MTLPNVTLLGNTYNEVSIFLTMSEISSNVKKYAIIVAVISLLCLFLSFTFSYYPFLNSKVGDDYLKVNMFGKGEAKTGTTTTELDKDIWDEWPSLAAWFTWIGFLVAFLAAVIYLVVYFDLFSHELLAGYNLSLGMMAGSAIAFLGMIWWFIGSKIIIFLKDTFWEFTEETEMSDTGFGAWFHLLFALVLMVFSHTLYTIERDLEFE
jgi:hypothetical protein